MSWIAFAARNFQSASRAWPTSSMHVATTDAPYSLARRRKRSRRVPSASPSSRLTELRIALPPIHWSPVSITFGSVEHSARVLGRGAAAPADDVDTELGDELRVVLSELLGREVVVHLAVDHRRQPGVRQARDRHLAVLAQVAQVLVHLAGTGGAV